MRPVHINRTAPIPGREAVHRHQSRFRSIGQLQPGKDISSAQFPECIHIYINIIVRRIHRLRRLDNA